ncbi:uncharacterized protein LOC129602182 isoform X2 [Paramacrobiotus metropolitanus]|uniref:uncharacterized protein LOC129602182 isoform X2 n=1 Tax=Paramacrobiotus metropolitanus TaxID=2943436 RepID=UPI00244619E5|nr:uncharacterized protein LOC129602182 isoform X2 [Paramacrobiotus metropolitanus]
MTAHSLVVEVCGHDKLFHCGIAVATYESGLIVDLGCPGRREEIVPFTEVYLSQSNTFILPDCLRRFNVVRRINETVEVLLRESSNEPWKWQPATIAGHDIHRQRQKLGCVRLSDGRMHVVPLDCIRRPVQRVSFSQGLEEAIQTDFMENMQHYRNSVLLSLGEAEESAPISTNTMAREREQHGTRVIAYMLSTLPFVPADNEDCPLRCLPDIILAEIFECLFTASQCRVRAVCLAWNEMFTSMASRVRRRLKIHVASNRGFFRATSDVRSYSMGSFDVTDAGAQRIVAVIVHAVCKNSQQLVALKDWPFFDEIFLGKVIKGGTEHLPAKFILKDFRCFYPLNLDEDFITVLYKIFDSLATSCLEITVTNFICEFQCSNMDGWLNITVRIPFCRLGCDRRMKVEQWWTVIETGCPQLDELQYQHLSNEIKKRGREFCFCQVLHLIVCNRHSNDPRQSAGYLVPFPAGPNPLESVMVNQLNPLSQYLLYCAVKGKRVDCAVTWPTPSTIPPHHGSGSTEAPSSDKVCTQETSRSVSLS